MTNNQKVADKFICVKNLSGLCPVSITLHKQLNASKGIVYAPCLINVPESVIVSEMKWQNVTEIYKFTKTIESIPKPTGLMLFTFDSFQPPETVQIGFYKAKVTEYFPNPMRCRNCQILGHTLKRCTNPNPACHICNLPPHANSACTRQMCANCQSPHPSDSKDCPKYIQMKEILKIKTKKKCTMADAKRLYKQYNPIQSISIQNSFSNVAHEANAQSVNSNPPQPSQNNNTSNASKSANLPQHSQNNSTSVTHNPSQTTISNKNNKTSSQTESKQNPPSTSTTSSPDPIINENHTQLNLNENKSQLNPLSINSQLNNQSSNFNAETNMSIDTENTLPISPISETTQTLLQTSNYFIQNSDDDDESI